MSIDRTSPLNPVSTVQPRETTDAPVTNTRAAKTTDSTSTSTSTSTSVTLSDAQAKLMQPGSSDINLERVEALKLAIRNGELKMDIGKIADALINEAQQDLQSN
ncbi:TPA: anti-sigma-28 factor FlgM [Shigella boydii]|uniref:Negative regulator of flagellin synthesis n=1 Tax=Shigella boydii 4444-74 TaxID=766140 RepID=I6E359_SHIBO|nr:MULTISPECIES: flagellar biosynthesis anti-sigma factor FlgM [Shigella]EHE6097386.1 anti-sigma-28 factor FlgM [Escherichia coli]EKG5851490.1 anti-sigma-28 factor FlgM [Shigella dysenteriae]AKI67080.1 flagellar biosynthesis anti-sigma factor FlgM [Shigella boydii]EAA3112378.1 anti-sigma-28 factor FlgM [Shigella flexneri]EFP9007978.1 anti-sigma-28 factor FlgM [Shigella boydii]